MDEILGRTQVRPGLFVPVLATAVIVLPVQAVESELRERIRQLEQRVAELEGRSVKSEPVAPAALEWLGRTTFSGFVSASFFHNFNDGPPGANAFVTRSDAFMLHKVKLALERPVDYDSKRWDAGFRVDMIAGEDAKVIHAAGLGNPDLPFDLEQASVNLNIPVGNGLRLTLGKTVTLMGVEVIEETLNPNWSAGNQFLYVENFTQLGGMLAYKWNEKVETVLAVFNGWDKVTDNNAGLSYMGKINLALSEKTSVALLGYGGPERDNNTRDWRKGAQVVLTRKIGDKVTLHVQGDYGQEDRAALTGDDAEWYAAGLWVVYQFHKKMGLALRGDYLADDGSSRTGFDPRGNANLASFTVTLNIAPTRNLHVRPEIRYDHCSDAVFTDGGAKRHDQVLLGVGASYLF
ncbi:MAG: outer membrane beta-barrel protein [Verrucomicrobiae bacterium]|nr:outer membrane beta-barrel protein [Verrucomicrobiae bacterium]